MKIKSIFIALMAVLGLVSCSKDGSKTIQLDAFQAVEVSPALISNADDVQKLSELFSIVPGEYTISWTLLEEVPSLDNYAGTFTVKLKLNKKLKVNDKFIKEPENASHLTLVFTDADGNEIHGNWFSSEDVKNCSVNDSWFSKDLHMDFVKFLQSEPGTEMDVTFGTILAEHSNASCSQDITDIQKAKGVKLKVSEYFVRDDVAFAE